MGPLFPGSYVAPGTNVLPGGTNYWTKNILRTQERFHVTLNDNILEKQLGRASINSASPSSWTPRNQNGGDPTARVQYVTITNNVVRLRHAGGGVTTWTGRHLRRCRQDFVEHDKSGPEQSLL